MTRDSASGKRNDSRLCTCDSGLDCHDSCTALLLVKTNSDVYLFETKSCINGVFAAGSINRSTSIPSSMLNKPLLSKRYSGTSVSDLGASHPYKVKLLCRAISEPVDDASANLKSSKSSMDDSSLVADNTRSFLGTSLDTSSLRQQLSDRKSVV